MNMLFLKQKIETWHPKQINQCVFFFSSFFFFFAKTSTVFPYNGEVKEHTDINFNKNYHLAKRGESYSQKDGDIF